jgi:hypothetical protein
MSKPASAREMFNVGRHAEAGALRNGMQYAFVYFVAMSLTGAFQWKTTIEELKQYWQ